jgi:hypothetical protein
MPRYPAANERNIGQIDHFGNPDMEEYYGEPNQARFQTIEHGTFTKDQSNKSKFAHPFLNTMYIPSRYGDRLDTNEEYSINIEHGGNL